MTAAEDILAVLKKHSKEDGPYINPNFLSSISDLLSVYYNLEDDDVSEWIQDMYGQ